MRIEVRDLESGYGAGTVVDHVDLDVESGETVAIVGRNGMGKSTFVKTLLGCAPKSRGSVRSDGRETVHARTHEIIRAGISYAPQEAALFANLSVRDNLYGALRRTRIDRTVEAGLFESFPVLAQRLDQRAGTLSGGEQKQLLLTRCLLRRPKALILDELSAGLQPSMVDTVARVLTQARRADPLTVVMVEQNVDLCVALAGRTVVMKRGRFIAEVPHDDPGARATLLTHLAP